MTCRLLRTLLILTSVALLLACAVTFAQRQRPTVQLGTPTCEPYTEEPGLTCRDLRCRYSGSINIDQECKPTEPFLQKDTLCHGYLPAAAMSRRSSVRTTIRGPRTHIRVAMYSAYISGR